MAWHSADTLSGIERTPTVAQAPRAPRRTQAWRGWALTTLAFVCGALVSAAIFTIGWRHQTQQNAAAQSALTQAMARNHQLADSLATARAAVQRDRRIATQDHASLVKAQGTGALVSKQATTTEGAAAYVSSNAATMASAAGRIASELTTLTSYLTTTPSDQLDPGYIHSQAAYLSRQVSSLQSDGGTMTTTAANFDAAIRKLSHLASVLARRK